MSGMAPADARYSRSEICRVSGHVWQIKNSRGHDDVGCIRCYQCLHVGSMLNAYIKVHGGTRTP